MGWKSKANKYHFLRTKIWERRVWRVNKNWQSLTNSHMLICFLIYEFILFSHANVTGWGLWNRILITKHRLITYLVFFCLHHFVIKILYLLIWVVELECMWNPFNTHWDQFVNKSRRTIFIFHKTSILSNGIQVQWSIIKIYTRWMAWHAFLKKYINYFELSDAPIDTEFIH